MSWNDIASKTNLSDDISIQDALKRNISGIYQIHVETGPEDAKKVPYELYISPIQGKKDKHVMVFFYPLHAIEDTIKGQIQSTINPIQNFINAEFSGEISEYFIEQIKKDFDRSGIPSIYQGLVKNLTNKNHTITQLEQNSIHLENELKDYKKFYYDVKENFPKIITFQKELVNELNKLKNYFLNIENLTIFYSSYSKNHYDGHKRLQSEGVQFYKNFSEIVSSLDQMMDLLKQVRKNRSFIKNSKDTFNVINRLIAIIGTQNFEQHNIHQERLTEIKQDLQELEKNLLQLDLTLSKTEIILNNSTDTQNVKELMKKVDLSLQKETKILREGQENLNVFKEKNLHLQDFPINFLKDIQEQYKIFSKHLAIVSSLLDFYEDNSKQGTNTYLKKNESSSLAISSALPRL